MTDIRLTQLVTEVAIRSAPSPPAGTLWIVEVNWADAAWPDEWDVTAQPQLRIMSNCLKRIEIQRQAGYPRLAIDTCTVTAEDPDWDVVPGRAASAIGVEDVALDRPCRVFATYDGVTYPQFFGYIRDYPAHPEGPPWVATIRVESPLRALLGLQVEVPEFTAGKWPVNTSATADSALHVLLDLVDAAAEAAGIPGLPAANREIATSSSPAFTESWGGGMMAFGQALAELSYWSGVMIDAEPRYKTSAAGINWALRVRHPLSNLETDPAIDWDWQRTPTSDLNPMPRIQYNADTLLDAGVLR
jgi:hypothetical protein